VLLLFISLLTQSGDFWIYPRNYFMLCSCILVFHNIQRHRVSQTYHHLHSTAWPAKVPNKGDSKKQVVPDYARQCENRMMQVNNIVYKMLVDKREKRFYNCLCTVLLLCLNSCCTLLTIIF